MTVAERKLTYKHKLDGIKVLRLSHLCWYGWRFDCWIMNPFVCRPLEARRRAYELLTHSYLRRKGN